MISINHCSNKSSHSKDDFGWSPVCKGDYYAFKIKDIKTLIYVEKKKTRKTSKK